MTIETCKSCSYFKRPDKDSSEGWGVCRRYPKQEDVETTNFCGEWRNDVTVKT